jgi:hypothetical protein
MSASQDVIPVNFQVILLSHQLAAVSLVFSAKEGSRDVGAYFLYFSE